MMSTGIFFWLVDKLVSFTINCIVCVGLIILCDYWVSLNNVNSLQINCGLAKNNIGLFKLICSPICIFSAYLLWIMSFHFKLTFEIETTSVRVSLFWIYLKRGHSSCCSHLAIYWYYFTRIFFIVNMQNLHNRASRSCQSQIECVTLRTTNQQTSMNPTFTSKNDFYRISLE